MHCGNWHTKPRPWQSDRRQLEKWINQTASVSPNNNRSTSGRQKNRSQNNTNAKSILGSGRQSRTQSDVGRKVAIVNTHATSASSGPITSRLQLMESLDDVLNCCMSLSRSQKASKCLIAPAQLWGKTIEDWAANMKRMRKRQPWSLQPYTPWRGLRSRTQQHVPTYNGRLQYRTPLRHCRRDQETGRELRPQKYYLRGLAGALPCKQWLPPNESGGDRDEGTHGYQSTWKRVYRGQHSRFVGQDAGEEVAQATATDRVENVKSETTGILTPEVLFEVLQTEVAFSVSLHARYKSASK